MHRFAWVGAGVVLGVAAAGVVELPWLACAGAALSVLGLHLVVGGRGLELILGGALGLMLVGSQPEGPRLRGPVGVAGVVAGAASGSRADLVVSWHQRLGGPREQAAGRLRVRFPDRPPPPGASVVVFGEAGPLDRLSLPGSPDDLRNARRGRLRTELRAYTVARVGAVPARVDPEGLHPLLRALALGDRSQIDPELRELFRNTGTAHLLAISGFHVGTVAAVVAAIVGAVVRLWALVRPMGAPAGGPALAAVVAAWGFATSVGLPISAQRAAGLVTLAALGRSSGRVIDVPSLLGLLATGVLVVDPTAVGSAAFQLSFGAVLGLVWWSGPLDALLPKHRPAWIDLPWKGLVGSTAATIGTLPACAWWFQSLPPASLPANLVAMPWTSLALVPCAFAATYGPEPVAQAATSVGFLAAEGLVWVLSWMDLPPWTPAVGPIGAAALGLAVLCWRLPGVAAGLTLLALGLRPLPVGELRLTFLDVGQGDAVLVSWPDGRRWLVDGGPPGDRVLHWLRREGVRHLDRVVATHAEHDHIGALPGVLAGLSVGGLHIAGLAGYAPLLAEALPRGIEVVDDPARRVHPGEDAYRWAPNDRSLVVQVEAFGWRALLMGDVEAEAEAELASWIGPAHILKVAHHGSDTSSIPAFVDAVQPRLAVAQVGRHNRYGHPHADVMRRMHQAGARVWRTDRSGTVQLALRRDGVWQRQHAGGGGWTPWVQVLSDAPDASRSARR